MREALTAPPHRPARPAGLLPDMACPACRGALHPEGTGVRCAGCRTVFAGDEGSYDFVQPAAGRDAERGHYDRFYEGRARAPVRPFSAHEWHALWHDPQWPERAVLLRRLGPIEGRVVLALGNGASPKELYFAHLGARLVITDLSTSGPRALRRAYDLGPLADRVSFHAVDAYRIPMADASVDVVYGFEFVHHLPDVPGFLDEAFRVLKPGGRCVFFDHAWAPLWQAGKKTVLRPLMALAHRVHGISPEDARATKAGGYREDVMARLAGEHGFVHPFFERTTLFQYLLINGVGKLLGWNRPMAWYRVPGRIGGWLDRAITARSAVLARNRIEMVWGFEKPGGPGTPA